MIPRTLHRVWLDDPVPETFEGYWKRWGVLHPQWQLQDWRSSAELPPLRNQDLFRRANTILPRDWKRFQSDVLRLELLYRYGGVYVDADSEPLRPFDGLLDGRECVVGLSPQTDREGKHPITNAVMAARPGHPFIEACLDGLWEAVRSHKGKTLAKMIGPWHLTRTFEAGDFSGSVTVLSHEVMYGGDGWVFHAWNNAARKRGEGAK